MNASTQQIAQTFRDVIGDRNVLEGSAVADRHADYCPETFDAGILLLPETTEHVSAICRKASEIGTSVVPLGGLTGLVEGTASKVGQVSISFERMKQVLAIDADQGVAVVEPGVTLATLFDAAEPFGLMPGVDIPSRGSCTIGGLVSTNAGGVRVIRYGMTRENVLGLEAVLADGTVIDATNTLMKNNAGYDLKQVFIGSEGTLGLLTKIVLRLHPIPKSTASALVACDGLESVMALLRRARTGLDFRLLSFEVMWPDYYRLTTSQPGMGTPPLAADHGMYAVLEVAGTEEGDADHALNGVLETAFEEGLVADAVIAGSEAQRQAIWRIRDDSDAISTTCETYLSYDVGMQLPHMPAYVDQFKEAFQAVCPDRTPYVFGHLGDGNLHIMFAITPEEYHHRRRFDEIVYGPLRNFAGTTVSAEHGIGLEKKDFLGWSRSDPYVGLMRQMKAALDPGNVLNPGKVI